METVFPQIEGNRHHHPNFILGLPEAVLPLLVLRSSHDILSHWLYRNYHQLKLLFVRVNYFVFEICTP